MHAEEHAHEAPLTRRLRIGRHPHASLALLALAELDFATRGCRNRREQLPARRALSKEALNTYPSPRKKLY